MLEISRRCVLITYLETTACCFETKGSNLEQIHNKYCIIPFGRDFTGRRVKHKALTLI